MSNDLLQIQDLTVTFSSASPHVPALQAVRGISYSLKKGEILGIGLTVALQGKGTCQVVVAAGDAVRERVAFVGYVVIGQVGFIITFHDVIGESERGVHVDLHRQVFFVCANIAH